MKKIILSITGNTATGTTTLTKAISERLGAKAILSENYFKVSPFFHKFLKNPSKWAFHNQIFFLSEYIEEYTKAIITTNTGVLCLDYHIYEIMVYSRGQFLSGYLSQEEFSSLERLQLLLMKEILLPDLTIYLQCDSQTIVDRLVKRNRLDENRIDVEYINKLNLEFNLKFSTTDEKNIHFSSVDYDFYNKTDVDKIIVDIQKACSKMGITI
ncbi:deoxynucleoside kinase [Aureispira sp. CCB-QB1]|uniref:deoxynucleoside kinase n=1 Tax=Aureispira sp. CCB-QB1 TaxID=1313421 RepID=UPI00069760CB|nr:deoxynucleoside kinase [Aureispira sp. CCB-QB1]